ncbi:hypothetical protein [Paraburkholderia sp. HP33-1]|uniref:hypothetical protein n=1 Tax=Paraburkholderia sp. HP33-1 TaxID=2883243 RepID=UPI001F3AECE8|nr:hypothetical protein [Paraburkholderia sp. HP33-1]
MSKKKRRIWGVGIFAALAVCITGTVYALPSSAAAVCPACYGFQEAGPNIYVQKTTGDEKRVAIIGTIEEARRKLTEFWGPLEAKPRILVCSDDDCFRRLGGGGRRGMSLFDRVAVLSPRGSNVTIVAHELSMNELHHRIGLWAFSTERMPIWFDEGIAMYTSNDLRYLSPASEPDRCLVPAPTYLPTGMFEWNRAALADHQLYAKAACRTTQWIASHGGAPGAVALVEKIAAGESFEEASR